jgi:hypothetical protein
LYPNAFDAVRRAREFGKHVILSGGDVVFQPHKVWRSGLYDAFDGAVLIYVHKELELEDVARRYPADHYVLVDDKVRILTAVKEIWGRRVTTVFARQGTTRWMRRSSAAFLHPTSRFRASGSWSSWISVPSQNGPPCAQGDVRGPWALSIKPSPR